MKELFSNVQSFIVMTLVLMGLVGLSYNMFREGGWIEKAVGSAWDYTLRYPLIVAVAAVLGIVLWLWWRYDRVTRRHKRVAPTIVLYAIMAAGAYFVGHVVLFGSL